MNKYYASFFVLLFALSAGEDSHTRITIEPHMGDYSVAVTQTYTLTQEGLTQFELLTVSLAYADLHIFDERGNLDYEIGDNIIIGRNIYRKITVFFREPVKPDYTFTVKYWFLTYATGKPVTGKYLYSIVNVTDSTTVDFHIPLTEITATGRASPSPTVEEGEDSTIFSYQLSEDTTIILTYELKEGIDYTDTETETFSQEGYTFEVTYPKKAEILRDNVEFFIEAAFPVYLQVTGVPLRFDTIGITLDKEEHTWAAAEYTGEGKIRVLINNTASYPFQFFAHELTHSYIGDFPRYLEEGMADYFEGIVNRSFAPPAPENYIFNEEAFYETYERQFNETVDITTSRYGLGLTDHQEALIYARYSKGTHVIYEIAAVCGHETVQEMLEILTEKRDCQLNQMLYELSEGEQVYQILRGYNFDVVPPFAYPAEELLQEVSGQSWWGGVLCSLFRFKEKIREAAPEDISGIRADIETAGKIASQTVLIVDGVVLVVFLFVGVITFRKVYQLKKENPKILYYSYVVPVAVACILFGYFLYEFLFHGHKFMWIFKNILAPWGLGIVLGAALTLLVVWYCPEKGKAKFTADVVWSASFFAVLVAAVYFLEFHGILLALGYVVSLVGLFVMRRRE